MAPLLKDPELQKMYEHIVGLFIVTWGVVIALFIIFIAGCSPRIAHIGENGEIIKDRPDLYSQTADRHERFHQAGYGHCPNKHCVMHYADYGGKFLCTKCWIKRNVKGM
jgi:hypothetical protein